MWCERGGWRKKQKLRRCVFHSATAGNSSAAVPGHESTCLLPAAAEKPRSRCCCCRSLARSLARCSRLVLGSGEVSLSLSRISLISIISSRSLSRSNLTTHVACLASVWLGSALVHRFLALSLRLLTHTQHTIMTGRVILGAAAAAVSRIARPTRQPVSLVRWPFVASRLESLARA